MPELDKELLKQIKVHIKMAHIVVDAIKEPEEYNLYKAKEKLSTSLAYAEDFIDELLSASCEED